VSVVHVFSHRSLSSQRNSGPSTVGHPELASAETGLGGIRRVLERPGEISLRVGDWRIFYSESAHRESSTAAAHA